MGRAGGWLSLLLLTIGNAGPLFSQVITERAPTGTPTVVAPVTWVSAMIWQKGEIMLEWPAATGASDYRVTRSDNTPGATEVTIFQGPWTNFVFEGKECTVSPVRNAYKNCVYLDKGLTKKLLYTYRVWTGGGPSPTVSAKAW
jgi:hypothetical protein